MTHSKTPWRCYLKPIEIYDAEGGRIAKLDDTIWNEGNAHLITEAVNQHEALVASDAAKDKRIAELEMYLRRIVNFDLTEALTWDIDALKAIANLALGVDDREKERILSFLGWSAALQESLP